MPSPTLAPMPGRWLWTCRAGFEGHLYEELAWADAARTRRVDLTLLDRR